jgi:hypothetical protein
MKNVLIAVCLAAGTAACSSYEQQSTLSPSATGAAALLGTWSSTSLTSVANACTDFKWNVTQQSGNSASGTFSATCNGDLKLSGSANGTLTGSTVTWSAQGTASAINGTCPISLTGTAELGADSIRVPYAGDTCLGKVSGVEILKKG